MEPALEIKLQDGSNFRYTEDPLYDSFLLESISN